MPDRYSVDLTHDELAAVLAVVGPAVSREHGSDDAPARARASAETKLDLALMEAESRREMAETFATFHDEVRADAQADWDEEQDVLPGETPLERAYRRGEGCGGLDAEGVKMLVEMSRENEALS